jgi:hypothetical protein
MKSFIKPYIAGFSTKPVQQKCTTLSTGFSPTGENETFSDLTSSQPTSSSQGYKLGPNRSDESLLVLTAHTILKAVLNSRNKAMDYCIHWLFKRPET